MMITTSRNIDDVTQLYTDYLAEMRQYYTIVDYPSWCAGAFKTLNRYATDPDHHLFMAKQSDTVIGFALVNQRLRFNDRGVAVAEFFIQRDHRQTGHGRRLATHLFSAFPGYWEIAVAETNSAARTFWIRVLSALFHSEWTEKTKPSFGGCGLIFNNK